MCVKICNTYNQLDNRYDSFNVSCQIIHLLLYNVCTNCLTFIGYLKSISFPWNTQAIPLAFPARKLALQWTINIERHIQWNFFQFKSLKLCVKVLYLLHTVNNFNLRRYMAMSWNNMLDWYFIQTPSDVFTIR